MTELFLCFCWYFFSHFNLAKGDMLFCRGKRELYGYEHLSYCDGDTQLCCDTGCCPKSKKYLLIFILLGSGLFICCLYNFIKCCRNTAGEVDPRRRSITNRISGLGRRFRRQPTQPGTTGAPEIRLTISPTVSRENVTQPLTPPPAYNVAIFAPTAPLAEAERVPSYEEVMEAERYKK